ncbi:uncharacterized protein LOC110683919 [Chenopodium quinoa]|uniref:uncharacterized protein LOC110683919 n=1 Tax=Chenopodium quinoa TaxID=63459 RepID=UPI000B7820B0|nr:uncharacterized protein LOC110683919 [Chenopodium quinoa]
MKTILWNVRGASSKEFLPHAKEVVRLHKPDILFLLETKSTDEIARAVCKRLGFEEFRTLPANGLKGGMWLFWRKPAILMDFVTESPHVIHSLFKVSPNDPEVLITGVHAPSASRDKNELWNMLGENSPPASTPWLLLGDMNEVVSQSEKMGGRPITNSQGKAFTKWTDKEGLIDLKYHGPAFTWDNGREGTELIRERLDRALANAEWIKVHPQTQVYHLAKTYSDHCPILVDTNVVNRIFNYPFRCKEAWLENPNFDDFFANAWNKGNDFNESKNCFTKEVKLWNKWVFNEAIQNKNRLIAHIHGIQKILNTKYSSFLINLEKTFF